METVLVIAAETIELRGLCRRLAPVRNVVWARSQGRRQAGIAFAGEAIRAGVRWLLVANGPGAALAREAFETASRHAAPDRVLNLGFCGALRPDLRIAQILIGATVRDGSSGEVWNARPPRLAPEAASGSFVTVDRIVQTASEKRLLRDSTGADAVEMEGAACAAASQRAGIPFHAIRAVSDLAGEDLKVDFNAARNTEGRLTTSRLLRQAIARPFSAMPELIRLARRANRASHTLGDFVAACQF